MLPYYVAGASIAVLMFIAAMAAEGRGSHILRVWLTHSRKDAVTTLRDDALSADVPREANTFNLVAHLGASERRYAELDARREHDEHREAA